MNYYEILQVSQKATDAEIKSSYKVLVKKYHPDLYPGDKDFAEQKIKEINEAYEVLSNPEKKAEYDEYLAPKPQYTSAYTQNPPTQTYTKSTSTNPGPVQPQWSFMGFIEKKFSKLEKNKQHQILVIIFFVTLLIFLINIIQTKNYLKNQQNKPSGNENTEFHQDIPYYEEYEEKTLDDLLYEFILQAEEEYYNNYYNEIEPQNTLTP